MKKSLLGLLGITFTFIMATSTTHGQDVSLYRTDNTVEAIHTYESGDIIDLTIGESDGSLSTSASCSPAVRRVQTKGFKLTVKSTSVSKIVITGNSSGSSQRFIKSVDVNGTLLTKGTDYTSSSTIKDNSSCDQLVIEGLNIAKNPAGTNITVLFSSDEAGTSTNQNVRVSIITLSPVSTTPLNFLSFTAKPDAFGKTVALNWSTTNEVNTASFAIQKRTDNGDFATIGNIPSKNTAGVHHYSFVDNNASGGNSYYRIVQYDNDHSSSNSEVQAVSIKASAGGVNIYPNPVADVLNANHSALQAGATAKISNSNGSTVLQQALTAGATQSSIDVSSLKPGVYILSISGQAAQKFVKR